MFLQIGKRDDAYPASEATMMASVDLLIEGDSKRLVFNCQDQRLIEIAARTVTLGRDV